jgi:hypothetical protein
MTPDDDDPVILPKDQGSRAFRWFLGFGGWMGVVVGSMLWLGTNTAQSPNLFVSLLPMVLFFGGLLSLAANRKWRKQGDDDF